MKFSNFLRGSKIAIYLALVCTVFTVGYSIISFWGVRLKGRSIFILPIIEGLGCILIIVALVTELIRYYRK